MVNVALITGTVIIGAFAAFIWYDTSADEDAGSANAEGGRIADAKNVKNSGWVASRDQTPSVVAEPTDLVDYPWGVTNTTCAVSKEDIAAWERDGYVLIKGVLDPKALDFMHDEAARICAGQLETRHICQIEQLRWQVNKFRDFMFYSQLGCYADKLIRGRGVRIATEALFGAKYNNVDPHFFSYGFHTDTPGQHRGTYHGFKSSTKGASAWFPFHDLNHETEGGSLNVIQGYPVENDCRFGACGGMVNPSHSDVKASYDCSSCHTWKPAMKAFTFKKGDVLYFHPDMPHKTQPVIKPSFVRHSFTVRLVESDAVLCNVGMACGDWMGCCRDIPMEAPVKVHSHCFPQIYPRLLDHEVAAHYSPEPKHLMGDLAWNDRVHTVPPDPDCV